MNNYAKREFSPKEKKYICVSSYMEFQNRIFFVQNFYMQIQGSSLLSEFGRRFLQIFWFQGEVLSMISLLSICSKLTTSLVNVALKFQTLIAEFKYANIFS